MRVTLRLFSTRTIGVLALCCLPAIGSPVGASDNRNVRPRPVAEIRIEALDRQPWRVTWRLQKPARQIVFARSTDDNRARTWIADACCEIVRIEGNEIARRRDGAEFREISLRVPPEYAVLPKDYAPFSPFGDGGMLFHSGRFFACGNTCPHDPRWRMRLSVPKQHHILLNGERMKRKATWEDSSTGRGVYIGDSMPVQTPDLVAVLDRSLPDAIQAQLTEGLPKFMRHFAARLGALETRPMLFASYDASFPRGFGSQGGVLPGQVFMHYYGSGWPERMKNARFANDLAWHFAHEAAHLYHRRNFDSQDGWIHEGSAEAFAALALREEDPSSAEYVQARVDRSRRDCARKVAQNSVRDVLATQTFDVAYSCGLVLSLAMDEAIRRISPRSDGLFGVWRELTATVSAGANATEEDFLAALSRVSNAALARAVRDAVRATAPDLSEQALLNGAAARPTQSAPESEGPSPGEARAGNAPRSPQQ
jgi:hypothetical protein